MIFFIAGGIDSGKTARMRSAYDALPSGTCMGFLSVKSYCSGEFIGYDLVELASEAVIPLARLSLLYGGQFAKPFTFDRFTFDQSAFDYGCMRILEAAAAKACLGIFIDEVGPMELSGLAFAPALEGIIGSRAFVSKDIYIAARSSCVDQICSLFGLEPNSVLHVNEQAI